MIAGRYTYRQLPALKETALVDPERERVRVFRPDEEGRRVLYPAGPVETLRMESVGLEMPIGEIHRE